MGYTRFVQSCTNLQYMLEFETFCRNSFPCFVVESVKDKIQLLSWLRIFMNGGAETGVSAPCLSWL